MCAGGFTKQEKCFIMWLWQTGNTLSDSWQLAYIAFSVWNTTVRTENQRVRGRIIVRFFFAPAQHSNLCTKPYLVFFSDIFTSGRSHKMSHQHGPLSLQHIFSLYLTLDWSSCRCILGKIIPFSSLHRNTGSFPSKELWAQIQWSKPNNTCQPQCDEKVNAASSKINS